MLDERYKDREWQGTITGFDEAKNILFVVVSDRGQDFKKEIYVDNMIFEKILSVDKLPVIMKEGIGLLSISKGDTVKWNDSMQSWQGVVTGKK